MKRKLKENYVMTNALCGAGCAGLLMIGTASAAALECLIEPAQVVELRTPVDGVIEKIHVQRGDPVKRGQTLAELEAHVERSTVESARFRSTMEGRIVLSRNRADFAGKKLGRSQELYKQNYVAAQARDDAEAEKRLAEAELQDAMENQQLARLELKRAEELLNLRSLRSPFDGVVVERLQNPGDLAESGPGRKPVLKLAQIDPLRVEVAVPSEAFGKLKPGMSATVIPEGIGGRHTATVKIVDRVFDAASGTFGVRLELANRNGALPGGMRCRVEFAQLDAIVPASFSVGAAKAKPR
jgi:RND family efflux transporter MFP subunit